MTFNAIELSIVAFPISNCASFESEVFMSSQLEAKFTNPPLKKSPSTTTRRTPIPFSRVGVN